MAISREALEHARIFPEWVKSDPDAKFYLNGWLPRDMLILDLIGWQCTFSEAEVLADAALASKIPTQREGE